MDSEYEAVVRSYYDYVDAEQYDELFSLFADDIVYSRPGQNDIDGMDDFQRFYLEERALTDGEHEIVDVRVDGDTVAVRGRFSGNQSGETVSFGFADFHQFDDDGLIESRWTYTDRDTV